MDKKKDIKDYLHLFLGCEMIDLHQIPNRVELLTPELLPAAILSNNKYYKPILRPLSSLTANEALHFAWLCMDSEHHLDNDCRVTEDEIDIEFAKNDNGLMLDNDIEIYIGVSVRCFEGAVIIRKDGSIAVEDEEGKKQHLDKLADKIRYLLSLHFDLFDLINSGIALEKQQEVKK